MRPGSWLRRGTALRTDPREPAGSLVELRGIDRHNLRGVDVDLPAGVLTVLTGVAGSGKSSLLAAAANACPELRVLDQSALRGGRRSMPATYLDAVWGSVSSRQRSHRSARSAAVSRVQGT